MYLRLHINCREWFWHVFLGETHLLFSPTADIKRNSPYPLPCNQYKNIAACLFLWPTANALHSANLIKSVSSARKPKGCHVCVYIYMTYRCAIFYFFWNLKIFHKWQLLQPILSQYTRYDRQRPHFITKAWTIEIKIG